MPIRIGGFDQISSYVASVGTASGRQATNRPSTPSAAAFSLASARARSLTSTAVTVANGTARAMASPMTPYPQPRSRNCPCAGGSVSRNSTAVARSRCPRLKTPEPLTSVSSCPHTSQVNVSRSNGVDGSALK